MISISLGLRLFAQTQEPVPSLADFFERLLASPDTPAPPYAAHLRVMDTIPGTPQAELIASLPALSAALKRDRNEIAISAVSALFSICRRPDGGIILRNFIPEIAALLDRSDERLRGGARIVLANLIGSNPDVTIPLMLKRLAGSPQPGPTEIELIAVLLDVRRTDPPLIGAIERLVDTVSEPPVHGRALQVLSRRPPPIPKVGEFFLKSLAHPDKDVKIAAINAVYSLRQAPAAQSIWTRAQPILSSMSLDPNEDPELRSLAERALTNKLDGPTQSGRKQP